MQKFYFYVQGFVYAQCMYQWKTDKWCIEVYASAIDKWCVQQVCVEFLMMSFEAKLCSSFAIVFIFNLDVGKRERGSLV